jgi:uncharacterized protein YrzB (UPF0473 family)
MLQKMVSWWNSCLYAVLMTMSEDERRDNKVLLLDITMSEDEQDNKEVLLLDITKIVILLLSSIQK